MAGHRPIARSVRRALVLGGALVGALVAMGCDLLAVDDSQCDPSCRVGYTCLDGECVPSEGGPDPGEIGAACTYMDDCNAGFCFSGDSFTGGYCSEICGALVYSEGTLCPDGSACVQVSEAVSGCLDLCGGDNGDCRPGYACKEQEGKDVCFPGCLTDQDCPYGYGCDPTTGKCEEGTGEPGGVGAPCTTDSDCADGFCVSESGSDGVFVGGYCSRLCDAETAVGYGFCQDNDGVCVDLAADDGSTLYTCFDECTTSVDCRYNYVCTSHAGIVTDQGYGICLPNCTLYDCAEGYSCDMSVGVCMEGSGTATTPPETTSGTLTSVSAGPTESTFGTTSVTVPQGAVSFSLIAEPSPKTYIVPVKVVAPNGDVVYDYFDPLKTDFKTAAAYNPNYYSAMFPNAPRLTLIPGTYKVTFGAESSTTLQLDAVFKTANGILEGGSLPVVFWFTDNSYMDAASAQNHSQFQQAVQSFVDIYASMGISVGPIIYKDVSGSDATKYAVIDSWEEFNDLFTLANGSSEQGLNFFFAEQFNLEGGTGLLGLSGGIPGPPSEPGMVHSGVAVAIGYVTQDAGIFAETIAHEAGHYLGLFHLSERDGSSHDPLQDTPECRIGYDTNGDGLVDGYECVGQGSDNLMFWTPGPVTQDKVTDEQEWVVTRNPMVK